VRRPTASQERSGKKEILIGEEKTLRKKCTEKFVLTEPTPCRNDGREGIPLGPLLGSPSEEAEDDSGGGPIVVLISVQAEGGPVVVHIEQTNLEVPGRVDIQSAARFERKSAIGILVTAGAGDGGV
jgi:hypothetical protein